MLHSYVGSNATTGFLVNLYLTHDGKQVKYFKLKKKDMYVKAPSIILQDIYQKASLFITITSTAIRKTA